MEQALKGRRIAVLVADGFEQVELTEPMKALEREGARAEIVSPAENRHVKGWNRDNWGDSFAVDVRLEEADAARYDALLLPGGVMNPDTLRRLAKAQEFVRAFFQEDKPVAAICHGAWTLIDSGVADGRRLTSYPSLQADLLNAGADWVDEEVVVDRGLVTSRRPEDIPAFNQTMIDVFTWGRPRRRRE
jgi:protease I